jgi:2,4-dichlorophenol 6-monooxygenase
VSPDGDALDTDRTWHQLCETGGAGAVLVRPDAMIAWRSCRASADPIGELRRAFDQILQHAA